MESMSKMRNAIRCLKCNNVIESKHRHDLQRCPCGACFVDGGNDYRRIGGDPDYIDMDPYGEYAQLKEQDDE